MSIARLYDRVVGLIGYARVARALAAAGKIGRVQTQAHADDELDHVQPYGFQSRPRPGSTAIALDVGGSAEGRVVLVVGDRRYTIALAEGEVALADDLGQRVHLTRSGIVIEAPDIALGASAAAGVARAGDPIALDMTPGTSWAAQVTSAINTLAPGSVTAPTASGTITSASSKVRSE